jgi:nucleoside-diphosphate-sugar epimerase
VYGSAAAPVTEDAPLRPVSPYGRSKLRSELLATRLADAFGLALVVVRYFTVYGPRQRPDMAFARYLRSALEGSPMPLYGDGCQVRHFTYVGDAAEATALALERGRPGERYLLGGEDLTFDDLFGRLATLTGRRPPRRHLPHELVLAVARADDLRCRLLHAESAVPLEGAEMARLEMYASSAKADEELGWRPGSVTDALERAVAWYRAA